MDDYRRRVACVEIRYEQPAEMLGMIFEKLPKDARLARVEQAWDRMEFRFYFFSSRFKVVPESEEIGIIKPTFTYREEDDRRVVESVEVEWPVQVEFAALRRA